MRNPPNTSSGAQSLDGGRLMGSLLRPRVCKASPRSELTQAPCGHRVGRWCIA